MKNKKIIINWIALVIALIADVGAVIVFHHSDNTILKGLVFITAAALSIRALLSGRRKLQQWFFKILMILATTIVASSLLVILWVIVSKGFPALNWDMI